MLYVTASEFNHAQHLLRKVRYNRPDPDMTSSQLCAFGLGISDSAVGPDEYTVMHAIVCGYAYVLEDCPPSSSERIEPMKKPLLHHETLMILTIALCCALPGLAFGLIYGAAGGLAGAAAMLYLISIAGGARQRNVDLRESRGSVRLPTNTTKNQLIDRYVKTEHPWHPVPRNADCKCQDCQREFAGK